MTDEAGSIELGLRAAVRWGLYPLSWAAMAAGAFVIWTHPLDPRTVSTIVLLGLLALYFVIELTLPYQRRWSMTWRSFLADIRMIAVNAAIGPLVSLGLGLFAITLSGELDGPARGWHPAFQLAVALLMFEAIYYTMHRLMHEGPGALGNFLWRVHAAHHLPPRVYLVMHGVQHPINALMVRVIATIVPLWAMGFEPRVVAMFAMISGVHGSISHFNADVRAGWLNYLFVTTELHRYHHSADVAEGKNYGAVLSVFDQLFGTFVYRPGEAPKELGVDQAQGLPFHGETLKVLALPFVRQQSVANSDQMADLT
jgi:sterol desaturase/sphingolipid hydroxylase (fatty acid hydroxylase superfamily)